ncbi:MAG: DUF456 domain-containing protein [Spirochaetaceae bacterium]
MALGVIMTVLGSVAVIAGLIGCVVPVLPGPIVSYVSLLLISVAGGWDVFAVPTLLILAALAVGTTVLDSVLPALSSRRAGAGRAGVWGSIVGMLIGTVFFPPFGMIVGAFVGALVAEIIWNPENRQPLKAAVGVFRGTILATLLKVLAAGVIGFYFVRGTIRLFETL